MDKMNIAFAGFRHGHIFELWNKAQKNGDVRIAGAWEGNAQTRAECEAGGVRFTYPDYDALLNDQRVDIVAIGDYFGARGSLAVRALKAGKHVIADKPLCTSLAELEDIERLSKEKSLSVFAMFSMRYGANASAVRELIGQGKLGEIHSIYYGGQHPLNYGSRPAWYFEEGCHGGTINDIGIHGVDYVAYVTGLRTEAILSARCWNAFAAQEPDFRDSAQYMLRLDNRAGVIADVSYASPDSFSYSLPEYWMFLIWGSKGMLSFSAGSGDVAAYLLGLTEVTHIKGTAPRGDYLTDMLTEIKGGRPEILTTAEVLASTRETLMIQAFADKN
ncbi:MAG: Gfo/Idh/MocA family oxidoreductase [Eubacteriales bacterium]|jgi:predicted dehydrogenase|nr:Gfo/Idh/MocA family oxidoreductase [Eubacteriales bacterium]